MSRVQLALNVADIDAAVEFYSSCSTCCPPSNDRVMPTLPSPSHPSSWCSSRTHWPEAEA